MFASFLFSTKAQENDFSVYVGCSKEDWLLSAHSDAGDIMYINKDMHQVYTFPSTLNTGGISLPDFQNGAYQNISQCRDVLTTMMVEDANISKAEDPPETTIYTQDHVELGLENKLICFVNHFYPPTLSVKWIRNNVQLTEGISQSRYHVNPDETFHIFSTLNFIPKEGDVYGCVVEHQTLDQPSTEVWVLRVHNPSMDYDILCGIGVGLGVLGIGLGLTFIVKAILHTCKD